MRALIALVVVVGAAAAVWVGYLAYDAQDAAGRDKVQQEVAKLSFQFLLVGILGVLFKFLVDRYHDRAKQLDTLADYRQEMLRRLVGVTSRVRKAPIIVSAHRTARAYNLQMRELLDAHSEISEIRHDIDNQGEGEKNLAFKAWPKIRKSLREMEKYLQYVLSEWQESYKRLSELQVRAEKEREFQDEVWEKIRTQPAFSGMLAEPQKEGRDRTEGGYLEESEFEARYLVPYRDALALMRRQTLKTPGGPRIATATDQRSSNGTSASTNGEDGDEQNDDSGARS